MTQVIPAAAMYDPHCRIGASEAIVMTAVSSKVFAQGWRRIRILGQRRTQGSRQSLNNRVLQ